MKWITQRLQLPPTLVLVIAVPGLLYPAPARADTLDQSQTMSVSPATVSNSTQQAQIFTASLFGYLDKVSVLIENHSNLSSPPAGAVLTVSVQTVIGGLPSGNEITSGTIPLGAIPANGYRDWVDANLRAALVVGGRQYALVLRTSSDFGSVDWWYANQYYGNYARGAMAFNNGTAWTINENYDFAFKTYVIPDRLDQSQTYQFGEYAVKIGTYVAGPDAWSLGQIFTAGLSGVLDRVRVVVERCNVEPLDVTIQTVSGRYPSGIVIGQGAIPTGNVCVMAWVDVGISGAVVTVGTQYALVIHPRSKWVAFKWGYAFANDHPYPGGEMVVNDGSGWRPAVYSYSTPLDADFQTYVAIPLLYLPPPPQPDGPQSQGELQ